MRWLICSTLLNKMYLCFIMIGVPIGILENVKVVKINEKCKYF